VSIDEPPTASAEDRLARLIDRLLTGIESAAAASDWNRVSELSEDILAVDPDNERATLMLSRARAAQALPDGQRAFVTLIFSDIVRSTDLVDVTEPEIVRALFGAYRKAAGEAIETLGGTILQFQGDGIVACFGYPIVHEDAARRAVLASLTLVQRMKAVGPELLATYGTELSIRVGLHTGTVVVSGSAAGTAQPSDIVGATAHVAARLQAEAEPDTVVVSESTRQLVDSHFELASVGTRALKGFARPMEVFQVLQARRAGARSSAERVGSSSVFGRDDEIQALREVWDGVLTSRTIPTPVVALRGPAGIGKSRLAAYLCAHVMDGGHEVLEASCSPYHRNVALWPITQMLEERLGLYSDQPHEERRAGVEQRVTAAGLDPDVVVPLLGPLLGLNVEHAGARPEMDPVALRERTLDSLADWLTQLARTTPRLFIVEDVHWADPTTVDLLALIGRRGIAGLMLLVTDRFELEPPLVPTVDIELGPLAGEDAAQLVEALASEASLDATTQQAVLARAGGVPLFIHEFAHSAAMSPTDTLPPRVQELMTARLRTSSVNLRTAQLAATLGAVFDEELLAKLAGAPVAAELAQLADAGILDRVGDARQGRYRFRDNLLRDAAYETQLLDSRRARHLRAAELLGAAATSPGDFAIIAQHLDLAGDTAGSIPAFIVAARAAQAEASHTEARRLLDRSLELLASLPEGDDRDFTELTIRMMRTVSVSSLFGYGYPDVFEDFELADQISRRHAHRPEIMPAQVGIWSYMITRGQVDAAKAVLDPLVTQIDAAEVAWFAPEISSCLGYTAFYRGELRSARRWLEEAWAGYESRPAIPATPSSWPLPHNPAAVTAVAMACVAGLEGRLGESELWEQRALAVADDLGFPHGPFSAAFVITYLAWLRLVSGNPSAARDLGEQTLGIAAQCRFDYFSVIGRQYALVPEPGAPVDAEQLADCGAAMDRVGHGAFRPAFLGIVATNHLYRGDTALAADTVDEALVAVQRSGEWVHQPDLLRLRAQIALAARPDRVDDVVADLRAAVAVGLAQNSLVLALRAAVTLARLPADARPADWRESLRSVVDTLPAEPGQLAGTVAADALALLADRR
jgi:class 3 adenylate cyclase